MIYLEPIGKFDLGVAQGIVTDHHYLHRPVDARCSVEGYWVRLGVHRSCQQITGGLFLLGRPEATRVNGWYGSIEDTVTGRCDVTRWQVLNLARVWVHPNFQPGGIEFNAGMLPGFVDRKGQFRSTLASSAISAMAARVGFDYLMRRPPCFLDEPYEIRWLMSYCDTRLHKGTIYREAGFELYRTNRDGIQTWRLRLPALSPEQDGLVREAARRSPRSQAYRAKRAQLEMAI